MLSIATKHLFKNRLIWCFLLFIAVFGYFLWLNSSQNFADPDAFYHAKMAELIRDEGIVHDFKWLPHTTLESDYIDHQLLYHIILIPFVTLFPPLVGMKISAALFAALAIILFQIILNKLRVRYSFLFTLLILFSNQFIFRLNLAKTVSLSVIFILTFLYFYLLKPSHPSASLCSAPPLWQGRSMLFILGFFYVWLYGGWPIILGILIMHFIVVFVFEKFEQQKKKFRLQISDCRFILYKSIATVAGVIAGLIINPYFPLNLKFYWQQTIQIGLVNFKNIVDVGSEWYGADPVGLVSSNTLIFIAFVLSLAVIILHLKKTRVFHWTLLLASATFLILTIKSKRNVEYFIPLVTLFSALTLNIKGGLTEIIDWIRKEVVSRKLHFGIGAFCLLIIIAITLSSNVMSLKPALASYYRLNEFRGISNWLDKNSELSEIVFHDNWSDWPLLFYWNDNNRYIVGLDPSFLYFADENKYFLWRDIVSGKIDSPCDAIAREFESRYIIIKKSNNEFRLKVEQDNYCQKVYSDEDGFVYKISN